MGGRTSQSQPLRRRSRTRPRRR